MKIEKLKSGNYRVRRMYEHQSLSMTFDHKPTKKEVDERLRIELGVATHECRPFKECAENYLNVKSNILSPATLYSYRLMFRRISDRLLNMPLNRIKQFDIQFFINSYAKDHKPKSVKNITAFILAVIRMFIPSFYAKLSFPAKIKSRPYIPNDSDVATLLSLVKGTDEEIPILLACFGLRRGEISALTLSDIGNGQVSVSKSMVMASGRKFVVKAPKTYESTRIVNVPVWLTDMIHSKGYVYNKNPMRISKVLSRIEKENGLPHFSVHKLRHYMASTSHALNIPSAYVQKQGGWATDSVLKSIYTHPISNAYDNVLIDHFNALYSSQNAPNLQKKSKVGN